MVLGFLRFNTVPKLPYLIYILFVLSLFDITVEAEGIRDTVTFRVPESVPVGHLIGYVEGGPKPSTDVQYFVVFTESEGEHVIRVDDKTGEITVIAPLDYETQKKYDIVAIPIGGGDGIPLSIEVEDENDNVPIFSQDSIRLEISEFAKVGAEFPLPSAIDADGPAFDVKQYRIAQGNVNNVFKLSSKRINNVLYADLVVNGKLDREYREQYELIIEAVDGGTPPNIGELQVSILILDANDNSPVFSEKAYHVTVAPDVEQGVPLLQVKATDKDAGHNGQVTYRLAETHTASSHLFSVSASGELFRVAPQPLPTGDHEIVVVALDHGIPPQESSVIVTISVVGSHPSSPALDIVWLTERGECRLPENQTLGSIVARVNVTNNELAQGTLELIGCPSLCLRQSQTQSVYLVILCGLLDRETSAEYHIKFRLKKDKDVVLEHPTVLTIEDVNDNAPRWNYHNLHITLNRSIEYSDDPNLNLAATDLDYGRNGRIQYRLDGTDLIGIDEDTGRLRYMTELDCSIGSQMKFVVHATDMGVPPQTSSIQVTADIMDSTGRPPQFSRPLYSERIREDADVGTCLLQVKAENNNCGGSKRIRYSLRETKEGGDKHFSIDAHSGSICVEKSLDYETTKTFQLTVEAHDQAGNTATSLVNIEVDDVNDNVPVFYPLQYNITVREDQQSVGAGKTAGGQSEKSDPLLVVAAEDADSGEYGKIRYKIVSGNTRLFQINSTTGEVFASGPLSKGAYTLEIAAHDGGGQAGLKTATVQITVLSESTPAPSFTQSKYEIFTSEDILPGISIGGVEATGPAPIRYSIYSGDPEHQFTINPDTGRITVARYLDADKHDTILLNVKAELEGGGSNHTQVLIHIEDHNDNAPEFAIPNLELTVSEDIKPQEAIYVVQAEDKDKKKNGELSYALVSALPDCPIMVQPVTGQLVLNGPLDYEKVKEYKIKIRAQDHGVPPRSADVSVVLHVSDVNDNAPVFERNTYVGEVTEHSPPMTKIIQVKASDLDSDSNGRIHYRLDPSAGEFGIESKSGEIFVKKDLDREEKSEYNVTVYADDGGVPPKSSHCSVRIIIRDINDHSPACAPTATLTVSLDADTRNPFGTIIATDPDQGENGTIIYRSQQNHPLFVVKANGDVVLRRPLRDSSEAADTRLSVVASDGGHPKRSSVCHVAIKVVEGTSSIKLVKPFQESIRIGANCEDGCQLATINATNVATWQIQSSDISSHFAVSSSGILSLVSRPPLHSTYSLTLVLSDSAGRQKHITIKILPYRNATGDRQLLRLSSKLPIGSQLATLGEKKNDRFYSIVNDTLLVEVDESSGMVYLTQSLKRHVGDVIDLHFKQVSLDDFDSIDKFLSLEVEYGAAERPKFAKTMQRMNLSEASTLGSVLLTLSANSSKANSLINYRILEGDEYFTIDPTRGDIILQKEVDWSIAPQLYAVIEAESDGATSTAVVQFDIVDTNNHSPRFLSSASVLLFHPHPTPVHYVVAVDDDSGDNSRMTYSIVGGDNQNFHIDENSGAITVLQHVDSDQTLTVRASDNGNPQRFTEQKIEIKLHHSTARWRYFTKPVYKVTVEHDAQVGYTVIEFPPTGSLSFSLFPRAAPFAVDAFTGVVKVSGKLAAEEIYRLTSYVEESGNFSDHASLLITVGRSGPAPNNLKISSASCSNTTVTENTPVDNLKRIVAVGTTPNATFQIQAGNDRDAFRIDERTGIISCRALDHEKRSDYILVITVQDNGRSDTCTVRIAVSDLNDNAPQFDADTPQMITIDDSTKVGDTLHKFIATDADSGTSGDVIYEVLDDESGLLDIEADTGRLFYAREMPVKSKEYMVRVRASDKGTSNIHSTDRFVKIRDHRTHYADPSETPQFLRQKYIGVAEEGQARGVNVARVSTSSRDAQITYSIVEGNQDTAFEIDSEGVIRTAQELDHEIQASYTLKVIATGTFLGHIDTTVDVQVLNINDNFPSFPHIQRKKLPEGTAVGTFVTTITANDVDGDSILEYSIETELADGQVVPVKESHFIMEKHTGTIHLMRLLDHEKAREIKLKIKAWDGLNAAFTDLTIQVLDENDNVPVFAQTFYDVVVTAGLEAGATVTQISAMDADSGENGRVHYSIDDPSGMFRIDAETGLLSTTSPLPAATTFLLTVRATDSGIPAQHSDVTVKITISSEHDAHQAVFEKNEYRFALPESTPVHVTFGNVSVESPDDTPLFYRVIDPKYSTMFDIDRLGRVYLRAPLDREHQAEMQFKIDVSSGRSASSENSTATVLVKVLDENDNAPYLERSNQLKVQLDEQMKEGHVVQRLSISDPDEGDNGRVASRIVAGDDYGIFSLESDTGALVFNKWNDDMLSTVAERGDCTITVLVRDYGTPAKFSLVEVPISIDIARWSGSAPFFVVPAYSRHVRETLGPGARIMTAHAVNRFGLENIPLTYSLRDNDGIFSIDSAFGVITVNQQLDYEKTQEYSMSVHVTDGKGRSAVAPVQLFVMPVDEYPPVFGKPSYTFQVPLDSAVGSEVGQLSAVDADSGKDGRIRYRLEDSGRGSDSQRNPETAFVGIDPDTGVIRLTKEIEAKRNRTIQTAIIIAESGPLQQTRIPVYFEIGTFGPTSASPILPFSMVTLASVAVVALFVALLCILILCVFRYKAKSKELDNPKKQVYSVSKGQVAVMTDINRMSPKFVPMPPLRSELPKSNKTSSLSSSASAHSNIRNSGLSREFFSSRSQPDSGIDPDTVSLSSSMTDYLTSLGVNTSTSHQQTRPRIRRLDPREAELNDYIYARVDDIVGPGPLNVSRTMDPLLPTHPITLPPLKNQPPPPFQPLSEIFSEIERLQKENRQQPKIIKTGVSIDI